MDGLRNVLGSIIATSDQRVGALLGSQQQTTVALFWVNALSSGLILALALAAGWTVARYTGELVEARRAVAMSNLTLESRVKDRTIALARANDEIQRFAYIVSHDLRAPLVNIVGFTSELESSTQALQRFVAHASVPETDTTLADEAKTAVDEDLPEAIGFIRASTSKMDRLINAILKLSREGRRELRPEPVDLKAVFEAIAASLQHQLDTAGARIDITKTLPTLVSDRLAIEQVFGNLIDNAVKYLSADRPGLIEISGTTAGSFLTLDVTDNGRGIAVGDQERIFELFRRAGTQNTAGEGIGLAHVRALVRRLGGDIAVTSELGRGSRFRVTLPRVYVSRPEQDPA
jgi:signal transduction histidine kinase